MPSPFVFKMRAYAAAHFDFNQHIEITWPDARAILQSEYTGGASGRAYAVTLYAEIFGEAESLEAAQRHLSGLIGNTLPIVAVAANAAIDNPLAIAVFGLDLSEPQELLWYSTPHASDFFPPGLRKIDPKATLELMTAVGHHPQNDLLHRAMESYRNALVNWFPERRLLAGEFLYIAAETLSRFLLETRAAERGMTPTNLARLEGAASKDALRATYLRDDIFTSDSGALDAMQAASNGFEHGYMAMHEVHGLIEPVLERSMTLVHRALIKAANVGAAAEQILLGDGYDEPRALVPPLHVVAGQLATEDPTQPAPADLPRLELDYPSPAMVVQELPNGQVEHKLDGDVKVLYLPDNVQIRNIRPGLRAAYVRPSPDGTGTAGGDGTES